MTEQMPPPQTTGSVLHRPRSYDLLVWLLTLGRERAFRERVVRLARLKAGESVLDVGCGTGTLTIAAKRRVGPTGTVCGIDASPEMIASGRRKASKEGVEVAFQNAVVEALPFPDAQFDAVLASMMLHHLPEDARRQCVHEIRRVLKPGGRLLAVDLGGAEQKRRGLIARFHRHKHVHFDLASLIPTLTEAGLHSVQSGPVGFNDLHFILAAPTPGALDGGDAQPQRVPESPAQIRPRTLLAGVIGLFAVLSAHIAPVYFGLYHKALPGIVAAGAIVLLLVSHCHRGTRRNLK